MRTTRNLRFGAAGAVAIVLLNAYVASHALGTLFSAQRWLRHTFEVLEDTAQLRLTMRSADSAARGYILTDEKRFEERFNKNASAALPQLGKLGELTYDNVSQRDRIAYTRGRITAKLEALGAGVALRDGHPTGGIDPAALGPALSDNPDGQQTVSWCLEQIESEETRLLEERTAEAQSARRKVVLAFAGATLLDLALLVVAFELLVRAHRARQRERADSRHIEELNTNLQKLNDELELRVEQRTRELEVTNKELEAFSYSVSHDLRAPLRTIDGFSLALMEDFSDSLNDEGRDYIARVRNGVQRMGTLIDALLQLSRVTRSEVVPEDVDMTTLATLVFNEVKALEPERDLSFKAEPGVTARGDARLIRIAFENLIGNAAKFTSKTPGALIEFGSSVREGQTVYFIRDNGAGFDMQYVDRLFTAFQRLHGDRDFKGSGIGLATVSRIIRRHHGTIWAEGEIGHGAAFYFTLTPEAMSGFHQAAAPADGQARAQA